MGQLDGCVTMGRFLVLMLLTGLAMAVLAFVSGFSTLNQPNGPHTGGGTMTEDPHRGIPPISDRHFTSGSAQGQSKGPIAFTFDLPIDRDKAYVQDGLAWIAFGGPGDPRAILVSLDEPEDSVAISEGSTTVVGTGGQCQFAISVTASLVEGDIDCVEADARRDGAYIGVVTMNVHFTAGS